MTNAHLLQLYRVWMEEEIDAKWQNQAINFFARATLLTPDASASVDEWLDQAAEADSKALAWALRVWSDFELFNSYEAEWMKDKSAAVLRTMPNEEIPF